MCEYKELRHKLNHFLKLMLYTKDKKKEYLNKLSLKTIFFTKLTLIVIQSDPEFFKY